MTSPRNIGNPLSQSFFTRILQSFLSQRRRVGMSHFDSLIEKCNGNAINTSQSLLYLLMIEGIWNHPLSIKIVLNFNVKSNRIAIFFEVLFKLPLVIRNVTNKGINKKCQNNGYFLLFPYLYKIFLFLFPFLYFFIRNVTLFKTPSPIYQ